MPKFREYVYFGGLGTFSLWFGAMALGLRVMELLPWLSGLCLVCVVFIVITDLKSKSLKISILFTMAGIVCFLCLGLGIFSPAEEKKFTLFPGETAKDSLPFSLKLEELKVESFPQSREIKSLTAEVIVVSSEKKNHRSLVLGSSLEENGWQIFLRSWEDRSEGQRGAVLQLYKNPWSWVPILGGIFILLGWGISIPESRTRP